MKYITITTWEIMDGADFDLTLNKVRTKRLPALKELGALRVQIIQTSDRTIAAISEWPDEATRKAAHDLVESVRKDVRTQDNSRMTGEMMGTVLAEA